ncbi:acyl-CoA dehydrogenase family protein [Sphingopyxis yananensis]|uniref:acyl-CoA dehydrogenase family protein n=1 Tax=Sphingopyxis yananensis TaxID=2886687 RepID=UPI001D10650A|nr:acyl-CoA dehydrogenase [Sphingopyxis yananensis]MCC2601966.1 acyl-CoA dehydrogenase [Sphingopyxis yananensis]
MEWKDALAAQFDRLSAGADIWSALAEAGALALPFSEAHGGLALSPKNGFAVLEILGPRAIATPYLEYILLAGTLLDRSGGPHAAQWLPRVAAGEASIAFASLDDKEAAYAAPDAAGWRLSGGKLLAIGAAEADAVIITAQIDSEVTAFLIPRSALVMHSYPTIDGRRAADILLDDVVVPNDARLPLDPQDIDDMIDLATAAICAEASAIMVKLVSDTRDYCVQRKQFDQAISSFQVIQHRLVDMHIASRRAAAAAALAADALDHDPKDRAKAISAAKVTIAETGRFVGQNAVQLHGGMGMTEELIISPLFKRLTVIESEFGTRDDHLARYMALG